MQLEAQLEIRLRGLYLFELALLSVVFEYELLRLNALLGMCCARTESRHLFRDRFVLVSRVTYNSLARR